jgi:alpha-1,3-glucan synthase
MGDLIGFDGFLNTSTPFDPAEHKVVYKTDRQYHDFKFGNTYNDTCQYPTFWNESGGQVLKGSDAKFDKLGGCFNSDFDQVS